jgi:hypothetical protein
MRNIRIWDHETKRWMLAKLVVLEEEETEMVLCRGGMWREHPG